MALEPPRHVVRWIHAPLSGVVRVVLTSRGETWWSHWTRSGSKRCTESGCKHCAAKSQAEPRYVYACYDGAGAGFIEFGSAQYGKLDYVETLGAVGVVLEIGRERARRNSVLCLEVVGQEVDIEVQEISGFVKSLGL